MKGVMRNINIKEMNMIKIHIYLIDNQKIKLIKPILNLDKTIVLKLYRKPNIYI